MIWDNVKIIDNYDSDRCSMEVVECQCGYHLGVDASFVEQVGGITTVCPSCEFLINYGYGEEDIDG